ncbi:MAG TPA: hypothetical protein VGF99_02290, partial [Myxococcota bacterium]
VKDGVRIASVSGLDALDYENTHHNWNDVLVATRGDVVVTWSVRVDFDDPVSFLIYEIEVKDGADVVVPTTRILQDPL